MGRLIGVDFGVQRVGIATADPLEMFSQPFGAFTPDEAIEKICEIETLDGLKCIVIGWPLLPDGSEGESTRRVDQYIRRIRNRIPGVRIVKWDERYSSEEARDLISRTGNPSLKKTGKGRVDTAAAGVILQDYMNNATSR